MYSALLIEDYEPLWRKLDRTYKPFAHGQAPRGAETAKAGNARGNSASVGDWLSLASDGRQKAGTKDPLEASLGVLARFLQFPNFCSSPLTESRHRGDTGGKEGSETEKGGESEYSERGSRGPRNCFHGASHIVKSDAELLGKWQVRISLSFTCFYHTGRIKVGFLESVLIGFFCQSQHVSLKDSITRATRERSIPNRQWALPPTPALATESKAWSDFLVSPSLAEIENDALKAKIELDDTLQHLHQTRGLHRMSAKRAESLRPNEQNANSWRENLQFSLLHGGISSR